MFTIFTVNCSLFSQWTVHYFHSELCTIFTVNCSSFSEWTVHHFRSELFTIFAVNCSPFSQWTVHHFRSELFTIFAVNCSLFSQWTVHYFRSELFTIFTCNTLNLTSNFLITKKVPLTEHSQSNQYRYNYSWNNVFSRDPSFHSLSNTSTNESSLETIPAR